MRATVALVVACLVAGCTLNSPEPPPLVAPAPEDLSTWSVPEVVTPPKRDPRPTPIVAKEAPPTAAEKVYVYSQGATYTAQVGVGFPLDIVFGRGELLLNITDGDRAHQGEAQKDKPEARRWAVIQGADGVGTEQRQHLFVTVTEPGLRNGLTVTSNLGRTFYITLTSVKETPVRVLRWKGEPEPLQAPEAVSKEPGLLPDPMEPKRWHVGYTMTSAQHEPPEWLPRYIVDDGRKTYIVLPEMTLFGTAPMVRIIGPNGPALVNARSFLNVIILDQLAARFELRAGVGDTAEVVAVVRGRLKTITCPNDPECPIFPEAAQALARSTP